MLYRATIEELGKRMGISVDCAIEYDLHPHERKTRDYPGCPTRVDLCDVFCAVFRSPAVALSRLETPIKSHVANGVFCGEGDWFDELDRIIYAIVEREWDRYSDFILEDLAAHDERVA